MGNIESTIKKQKDNSLSMQVIGFNNSEGRCSYNNQLRKINT